MVNGGWHALCDISGNRNKVAKMRNITFRIGSKFETSKRPDPLFENALNRIRNAVAGPQPVLLNLRTPPRRSPTRFQARLAELSKVA